MFRLFIRKPSRLHSTFNNFTSFSQRYFPCSRTQQASYRQTTLALAILSIITPTTSELWEKYINSKQPVEKRFPDIYNAKQLAALLAPATDSQQIEIIKKIGAHTLNKIILNRDDMNRIEQLLHSEECRQLILQALGSKLDPSYSKKTLY